MGDAILDRATRSPQYGTLLVHDPDEGGWYCWSDGELRAETDNTKSGAEEVVAVFDWSSESLLGDEEGGVWLEAAADALFAALCVPLPDDGFGELGGRKLFELAQDDGDPNLLNFHFIGHSRGAVLNTLVTQRFYEQFPNHVIDQVTSLDPHPAYGTGLLGDFLQYDDPWSEPGERAIPTFDNVHFTDAYSQADGVYEFAFTDVLPPDFEAEIGFDGVAVSGSSNLYLDHTQLEAPGHGYEAFTTPPIPLPPMGPLPLWLTATMRDAHSDVHLWYHGTIDTLGGASDGKASITAEVREDWYPDGEGRTSGWVHSRINGKTGRTDEPGKTDPESAGAPDLESVFNGDFDSGDLIGDKIPGWSFQGGGGAGNIDTQHGDRYLVLNTASDFRTHNLMYFPADMTYFSFDFNTIQLPPEPNVYLKVTVDGLQDDLFSERLWVSGSGREYRAVPIPESLRGESREFTVQLVDLTASTVYSEVRVDNFALKHDVTVDIPENVAGDIELVVVDGSLVVRLGTDTLFSGSLSDTNSLVINGTTGNDRLTVDFSGGNPIPRGGLEFNGGAGATDSLQITGGRFTDATFDFANLNDGFIDVDGSRITYTGLEPITSTLNATNVMLNYGTVAETITVADAGVAGQTIVTSTAGESVTFNNPTGTLAINAGDAGDDEINVQGLGPGFLGNLTIDGEGGDDTVSFQANATNTGGGNLLVTADDVNINAAILSGGGTVTVRADNDVIFGANGLIDTEAGSAALVTVSADHDTTGGGGINMADGTAVNARNGDIQMSATDEILLSQLTTMADATITSTSGAISDGTVAEAANISARSAALRASAGIGSGTDINTAIGTLAASNTTTNNIEISNSVGGLLTIGTVAGLAGVTNTAAGGTIVVTNASPLTIDDDVLAVGAVMLAAMDDATDTLGKKDDLIVSSVDTAGTGAVEIISTGSNITLRGGDDVLVDSGSTVSAATGQVMIEGDFNSQDTGTGSVIDILGTIISFTQATLTGNADCDEINLDPDATDSIQLDGAGGSDSYTVQLGNLGGQVDVDDQAAEGSDDLTIYGTDGADVLTVNASQTTGGGETVAYAAELEFLEVSALDGQDTINVTPFDGLQISIFGGNLIVDGSGSNDVLAVVATGAESGSYVLTSNDVSGPTVNFAGLTSLTSDAGDGNDNLTITHPGGGLFTPAGGIFYNGEGAGGDVDSLTLNGGMATTVTHSFADENNGTVDWDGPGLLTYTGLEPILDSLDATDRVFTFPDTADDIVLSDDVVLNDEFSQITSVSSSERVAFRNPRNSLIINADNGAAGNDTVTVQGLDSQFGANVTVTVNAGAGDDRVDARMATVAIVLNGGDGNDQLEGGNRDDTLLGGDGNDRLLGGPGNDILAGQDGDDFLAGQLGDDLLLGGLGNDTLKGRRGDDFLTGQDGHDVLKGGVGNDLIFGRDGDDILVGQRGSDTLYGGSGNDLLRGGNSNDSICGDSGEDTLLGQGGSDTLNGGSGNDVIEGNSGNDSILGDWGHDTLVGNGGNDTLYGGPENDVLVGSSGNDLIFGEWGNDTLDGQGGIDTLHGDSGNDLVQGGDGDDVLYGGSGRDIVVGLAGADRVSGGPDVNERDTLAGGSGQGRDFGDIVAAELRDLIDEAFNDIALFLLDV